MAQDIADGLLERYCAGDCTPAERAEVERWLAADPARADRLALLAAAWREAGAASVPAERPDVASAWERIRRRGYADDRPPLRIAMTAEGGSGEHRLNRWRRFINHTGMRAAAAALVLAVGGAAVFTQQANHAPAALQALQGPMRDVVTHRGQRAALDLPDGSRVVVAAESRLRIPAAYGATRGPRELLLDGEAYFEVRHDGTRPFRVHAANGIVEDIGTAFVVTAYPETHGVQVVVADGAVALRTASTVAARPRALLTLGRGQLGRLDSLGTGTVTREVAVAPYTAWTAGKLVFEATPMREVVPRLARWYDLDIRLADSSIADRRFTSVFQDETPRQVLGAVALSLGLRVAMTGRHVVLSPAR